MSISIRQVAPKGLHYRIEFGSQELVLDMPPPQGEGPDPHAVFDASLGGCKAMTLMLYAQRKGIPLESVDVDIEHDDTDERQGVYRLQASLTLGGPLSDAQMDELLGVADRCPVHKLMTRTDIQVTTSVRRPAG